MELMIMSYLLIKILFLGNIIAFGNAEIRAMEEDTISRTREKEEDIPSSHPDYLISLLEKNRTLRNIIPKVDKILMKYDPYRC